MLANLNAGMAPLILFGFLAMMVCILYYILGRVRDKNSGLCYCLYNMSLYSKTFFKEH